jgi:serine/threonine-protein kinase
MAIDLCCRLAPLHRSVTAHGKLEPSKVVADNEEGSLRNARIVNPSLLSLSAGSDDKSAWDKAAFPYFSADHFLSPEQKAGKKATPASDIYALGAIMYTALTGSPPAPPELKLNPFKRNENLHSKLIAYGVPSQLETIVLRCLKANPRDRYQSSDDLLSAIAWWDPAIDQSRQPQVKRFVRDLSNPPVKPH